MGACRLQLSANLRVLDVSSRVGMCECSKKCLARCGLLGTCKPLRAATLTLSSLLLLKLLLLQVMSKTEKDEIFGLEDVMMS